MILQILLTVQRKFIEELFRVFGDSLANSKLYA